MKQYSTPSKYLSPNIRGPSTTTNTIPIQVQTWRSSEMKYALGPSVDDRGGRYVHSRQRNADRLGKRGHSGYFRYSNHLGKIPLIDVSQIVVPRKHLVPLVFGPFCWGFKRNGCSAMERSIRCGPIISPQNVDIAISPKSCRQLLLNIHYILNTMSIEINTSRIELLCPK